jgi:DNA-binding transcriptional ArsR family regulator
MMIFPELSKNAWKTLLSLSHESKTAKEISQENNIGLNRVSEALDLLKKFGILKIRERRRRLTIDPLLKEATRNISLDLSREQIVRCMEGKKLNILFQILEQYVTLEKLNIATGYSVPTLKRALKDLQNNLLVFQPKRGEYNIRDEMIGKVQQLYSSFFSYFLDSLNEQKITWKIIKVFGNSVLIKSTQKKIPDFSRTSFSIFHKFGIDMIETNESFFVNSEKEPNKEEVLIHALVFSQEHSRDMAFCILYADINNLKPKRLETLSKIYNVEKEVTSIFEFLKTQGKIKTESMPSWQEYISIRRDYERS